MLDKNGNKVNRIRHIRCKVRVTHPLSVKRQTMKSDKDYKNYYYADTGDLYTMCKYENRETKETEYKPYNLFEVSQNMRVLSEFVPKTTKSKKGNELHLVYKLTKGDMVLLFDKSPMELEAMDSCQLAKRLYVIKGFEADKRITMAHHANALPNGGVGMGENIKDYNNLPQKIRQVASKLNFLVEGIDFRMLGDKIEFITKLEHYD